MKKEVLLEIFYNNKGKVIGSAIGFILAILAIIIGFFKTLFIAMCVLVGYYVGKKVDNKESIIEIIERILPDGWK
ncbi:DUF2273 domain-containing protein [Fonticella tunisiensis]|uniref:Putative membrane protein n=1 Tax=Fonticella tunisiensis TaxID=1096341 RepID=A0A4R7KUG7_9CLOT|nr:DUF2273 domain-containing protein [Fonticella tunisiensis]TDT61944.1 putative membrane protein [Fonticella tunisiensis]